MNDLIRGIFFDADGDGASGEAPVAPAPIAPAQAPARQDVLRGQKPKNVGSFLKSAPVMNAVKQGAAPEPEGGIPAPQTTAAPAKETDAKPDVKEPLVKGPGSLQQPKNDESGGKAAGGDTPSGEPAGTTAEPGGKVKIGDLEHTAEEWERFAKDYANDTTWKANNAKKSQVISKFSDEMLSDVVPYALSQRELPKDFKKKLAEMKDLPEVFSYKDADGYDVELRREDIPDEFYRAVRDQALVESFPEYMKLVEENTKLKEKAENVEQQVSDQEIAEGTKTSVEFMKGYPEFAVTMYPGDRLESVLSEIFKVGEAHPEYENARRFGAILNAISVGMYRSFDEAAQSLFGARKRKTETVDQVNANQSEGRPEEPGGRATQPVGGNALLKNMASRGKGPKYANLGRS